MIVTNKQQHDSVAGERPDIKNYLKLKRFFGLLLGIPAFILLLPFGAIISILIMIDDPMGGSPIFLQDRLGRGMKPFKCVKFRTMRKDAPHNRATRTLDDTDKYITRIGRILRKSSIDELPQLWNVIRGEMSLVGPRPLILSEMDVHEKRNRQGIYNIRPGLTGLAQISGRDLVDDEDKVDYDYRYYLNLSFKLDIEIVLRTILKIVAMDGIVEGAPQSKISVSASAEEISQVLAQDDPNETTLMHTKTAIANEALVHDHIPGESNA